MPRSFGLKSQQFRKAVGGLACLDQIRSPERIAYGATTDRKHFVVLAFDDEEHNAAAIAGDDMPVLILADQGAVLQNMPHKEMKETTVSLCGVNITFRTEP